MDYGRLTPKERQRNRDTTVCEGCFHQRGMHVPAADSAYAAMCKGCDCYCDCCREQTETSQGCADVPIHSTAQVCRRCHHARTQHHHGWADILNRPGCSFRGCPCKEFVE